ncbi:hypothetical protein E5676_scaffold306G004060 [Cucumis melo var. makuwa]|uniref:Uncharacterized protein n=1 Tax=Cucumis melo var. makuwa TaxID=1194695 RepID=A0A5D3D1K4_CUCMM|nr:hypothetical protein E6C27_scaffold67G006170 [Cucumis melo var. makuwa]TYK18073.1 hypothetical protein E5676_scaffold306G004060 [Cucumis melo var. makuwa]
MDIDMTRVTRRGPRIPTVLGVPRDTEDQSYAPMGAHVARVRKRARDWVEDEPRARASWRATRSETVEGHRDYRFRLPLFQIFVFEFEYFSFLIIFIVDRARVGL